MLIALDDRFLYVFKKAVHFFGIGDKVFGRVIYSKKSLSCGAIVEYDVELQFNPAMSLNIDGVVIGFGVEPFLYIHRRFHVMIYRTIIFFFPKG